HQAPGRARPALRLRGVRGRHQRAAAEYGIRALGTVIPGVTGTCSQMSVTEDRPGNLSEHRVRLCRLNAVRVHEWQRREAQAGKADWIKSGLVIEVESARDPREAGAGPGDQVELLREGRLRRRDLHVDDRERAAVLIEKIVSARIAVGRDAHEARPVEV